jgi:methylamine dehydrogenase heavy chain
MRGEGPGRRIPRAAGVPIAMLCLVGVGLGVVGSAAGESGSVPTPERAHVARLPEPGAHWVWVPDRLLGHSLLFDGDAGTVLGVLDTPNELMFPPPLLSRRRAEVYSADIVYARGTRGPRSDFVSIYDATTLVPLAEVAVPTRLGQSNTSYAYAELLGERFLALFNQFPEVSVSIVDLERRVFVGAIPIAGCAGVFPVSSHRFATLCGDGTALQVTLDASGRLARRDPSEPFFDPVLDPVAMPAGRDGARWTWVSFGGRVHTVDFAGDAPSVGEGWSLLDAAGATGWRPGGLQHVAVHPGLGRLYVIMHEGGPGTHKEPGPEVWVYDLAEHTRVARFEAPNLTAAFLAPLAGVAPGTFTYRLMEWLLPVDGIHTIVVTGDDDPVLFVRNAERGAVAMLDARTGETRRILTDAGLAGPTLRVP